LTLVPPLYLGKFYRDQEPFFLAGSSVILPKETFSLHFALLRIPVFLNPLASPLTRWLSALHLFFLNRDHPPCFPPIWSSCGANVFFETFRTWTATLNGSLFSPSVSLFYRWVYDFPPFGQSPQRSDLYYLMKQFYCFERFIWLSFFFLAVGHYHTIPFFFLSSCNQFFFFSPFPWSFLCPSLTATCFPGSPSATRAVVSPPTVSAHDPGAYLFL